MNNNQQPQQSTPQVPDQRFNEIQAQVRELREQNVALRNQVDMFAKMSRPNAQPEQKQIFQPDVDQALTQKFQQMLQPIQQQVTQAIGMQHDRIDRTEFQSKYSNSPLKEYMPEVERIMEDNKLQNRWIPREQVIQYVHFQQTGRKAQEPTQQSAPAQPQATYNPYLGQWTGPDGKPTAPPAQAVQPQGLPPQSVEMVQPQTQQASPVQQVQQPASNQYVPNQTPNLPPSTPPPQSVAAMSQTQAIGLDLKADDKALNAWADKYGDVPL